MMYNGQTNFSLAVKYTGDTFTKNVIIFANSHEYPVKNSW